MVIAKAREPEIDAKAGWLLCLLAGQFSDRLSLIEHSLRASEQLRGASAQTVGDSPHRGQRRCLRRSLEPTEVGAINATGKRGRFLAQVAFFPKLSERCAKGLRSRYRHALSSLSVYDLLRHGLKYPAQFGRTNQRRNVYATCAAGMTC